MDRSCATICFVASLVLAVMGSLAQASTDSLIFSNKTGLFIESSDGTDVFVNKANVREAFTTIAKVQSQLSTQTSAVSSQSIFAAQLESRLVSQSSTFAAQLQSMSTTNAAALNSQLSTLLVGMNANLRCLNNPTPINISTSSAISFDAWTTLDGVSFLAVANYASGVSFLVNSAIYQYNPNTGSFFLYQTIPTQGAYFVKQFPIDGVSYIAISQYTNGATRTINSIVMRHNGNSYVLHQSIPTKGAIGVAFFRDLGSGEGFLAFVNHYDDSTFLLDSQVLRWNNATNQFVHLQYIQTNYAETVEFLVIGNVAHLFIANAHGTPSYIHRWNGAQFVGVQNITNNNGARHLKPFVIGNDTLLVATNHDGGSSEIFKYRSATSQFTSIQNITTTTPLGAEAFTIGANSYLFIVSDTASSSPVFQWDPIQSRLNHFQDIPTALGYFATFFTAGSDSFLAVPSLSNTFSVIYKWCGSKFALQG